MTEEQVKDESAPKKDYTVPWSTKAAHVIFLGIVMGMPTMRYFIAAGAPMKEIASLEGIQRYLVEGDYPHSFWGALIPYAGLIGRAGLAFAAAFAVFYMVIGGTLLAAGVFKRRPWGILEGIAWAFCFTSIWQAWGDPIMSFDRGLMDRVAAYYLLVIIAGMACPLLVVAIRYGLAVRRAAVLRGHITQLRTVLDGSPSVRRE